MPPKRAAPPAGGASANKKAKSVAGAADEPPRSKRWALVSGSANADNDYKTTWKNPERSYAFITICTPRYSGADEDDDDGDGDGDGDDDDDDDDVESGDGPKCGKKGCVCFKSPEENPEQPWIISRAGHRKFYTQFIHAALRDPDAFGMYTFNDHAGYGCLELVQNLVLDFVEAAARGWREQWAVCEGIAHWLSHPASMVMTMIDDGECVNATFRLIGRMFLYMLSELDKQDLVGDNTEVKSLGCIMAMYMKLVPDMRPYGVLEAGKGGARKTFKEDEFDDAILSYAKKRGVTLRGPGKIGELAGRLRGEVDLPKQGATDPWGWNAALKKYQQRYKGLTGSFTRKQTSGIGGDALDMTTWTSAERKAKSFDSKDPLGKKEMDAIKQGLVMQPA
ncbi:hypothetical protein F4778DRAFT_775118 [Xylariomycetidae sp. FL2044]|nr:hypothetical protein F4778DRAFT_775118 [Xylariomycetidae sp. FL2044]